MSELLSESLVNQPPLIKVSVVVPCFNCTSYVQETLHSALNQTTPPHEVIVVDDGSTDDSANVAASVSSRVQVIRQANGGPAAARNAGVKAASGDWIAFLDSDDLWEPQRLARLVSVALRAPEEVVCIVNDLTYLEPDGSQSVRPTPFEILEENYPVRMLLNWLVNPSGMLVRSSSAKSLSFPSNARGVEDQLYLILLRGMGRFLHLAEPLTKYRRHPGQLTADCRQGLNVVRTHLNFMREHPELYSPADVAKVRRNHGNWIVHMHDLAYWARNNAVANECRHMYFLVHPEPEPSPGLFGKRLYPSWIGKAKDLVDGKLSQAFKQS